MANLAKYIVQLEAQTAKYVQELDKANRKLDQFDRRNQASLQKIDRGFLDMSNRFTAVAGKLRAVFGLFGVAFGVRAFAGWIRDAIEIEKLTDDQAKAIGRAREAMGALGKSVGDVAREFATRLAHLIEMAAKWWKELLFPSGSQFGQAADLIREQVDAQIQEVDRLQKLLNTQSAYASDANWFQRMLFGDGADNVVETTDNLSAARVELERLRAELEKAMKVGQRLDPSFEQFLGQIQYEEEMRRLEAIAKGQEYSPEIRNFIENLQEGERLTESMRTEVEKQTEAWQRAVLLFESGAISEETLRRLEDSMLQPIEVTATRLHEMTEKGVAFAETLGRSFKSAFADWMIDSERKFGDLLRRMAAEMVASGIFEAFASMFSGGTSGFAKFFSSFFGGKRAEGGPVSAGRGYLVGEQGPELFVPSMSGTIIPAGIGGMTFAPVYNIDARGADQSLVTRLPEILETNNQKMMARIRDLQSRNRF